MSLMHNRLNEGFFFPNHYINLCISHWQNLKQGKSNKIVKMVAPYDGATICHIFDFSNIFYILFLC